MTETTPDIVAVRREAVRIGEAQRGVAGADWWLVLSPARDRPHIFSASDAADMQQVEWARSQAGYEVIALSGAREPAHSSAGGDAGGAWHDCECRECAEKRRSVALTVLPAERLAEIEANAKAAPAGPWQLTRCDDGRLMVHTVGDTICFSDPNHREPDDKKTMRHLAGLDRDTVLAMTDEIRSLARRVGETEHKVAGLKAGRALLVQERDEARRGSEIFAQRPRMSLMDELTLTERAKLRRQLDDSAAQSESPNWQRGCDVIRALLDAVDNAERERDAFRDMKPGRKSQRRQIMRLRHGDNTKAVEALCKAANEQRDRAIAAETALAAARDALGSFAGHCCTPRPGEPFFVLLGRDAYAPSVVEAWAIMREAARPGDGKIANARKIASEMRVYSGAKVDPEYEAAREAMLAPVAGFEEGFDHG